MYLIFAIGISEWPQFARVTRASTLVEKNKEYVSASRIIGLSNILLCLSISYQIF